jgi:hypothetical protein
VKSERFHEKPHDDRIGRGGIRHRNPRWCYPELDSVFPLANIEALPRLASDHIPLIWDAGLGESPKPSCFKFEKWWLMRAEFKDVVAKS